MNKLYVAIDGDNAGQQVGAAVLKDDAQLLNTISTKIKQGGQTVRDWVSANGGTVISEGGDEATFFIDPSKHQQLLELKKMYENVTGFTVTIGTGLSLSQAGKSLMAGKLSGKNMIINYDDHIEQILSQAHSEAMSGAGGKEAQKIDEHYLSHVMDDKNEYQEGDNYNDIEEEMPEERMPEERMPEEVESSSEDEEKTGCNCPLCTGQTYADASEESLPAQQGLDLQGEDLEGEKQNEEQPLDIPESSNMEHEEEEEEETPTSMEQASKDNELEQKPENQVDALMTGSSEEDHDDDDHIPELDDQVPNMKDSLIDQIKEPEKDDLSNDTGEEEQNFDQKAFSDDQENFQNTDDSMVDTSKESLDQKYLETSSDDYEGPSELNLLSSLLSESQSHDDTKNKIKIILKKFKQNKDIIVSMKRSNPDLYDSIIGLLKQTIELARHMEGSEEKNRRSEVPNAPKPQGL